MLPVLKILPAEPTPDQSIQIRDVLPHYNRAHDTQFSAHPDIGIVIKDGDSGKILGGLHATDEYNWLYIKYLVVPDSLRGAGGKRG